MLQTEIAKYAMWLFGHSVRPGEELPELYDLLRRKNPVGSESLGYRDFEVLFEQWQWQQVHGYDAGRAGCAARRDTPGIASGPAADGSTPAPVASAPAAGDSTPAPVERPEPVSAACDYHVATEFLIEELIATVKQHLAQGWRPLGGIAQSRSASGVGYWAQALVRTEG